MKLSRLTKYLFGILGLVLLHIVTTSNSAGYVNSLPNLSPCSQCHGNNNPGTMTITGIPSTAIVNTTYTVEVCINDNVISGPNPRGGFRFDFVNGMGTYSNLGTDIRDVNGNTGVTHDGAKNISNGQVCWDFDWTAPISPSSSGYQVYGNATNGNNSISGDHGGYFEIFAVSVIDDPCTTDLVITDNPIPSNTYEASNSITANTPLAANAVVTFEAPNCVDLQANFEVPMGADFETLVGTGQGCLTAPAENSIDSEDASGEKE